MNTMKTRPATATIAALLGLGVLSQPRLHADENPSATASDASPLESVSKLVAVVQPVGGSNVTGSVVFEETADGVRVTARIGGLEPGSKHGIHLHEFGDITADDGTSAGGHYNPEGNPHGLPDAEERHAGDLGNLEANDDGDAELTLTVDNITLTGDENPIVGRAVIVHSKRDDGGQPTGNAGQRIGAGVIGVAPSGS